MPKLTTGQKIGVGAGIVALITTIVVAITRAAPPTEYCCLYCGQCFATYEELVAHIQAEHPGERIPLPIEFD